jgi:hypothetical protein
MRSARHGRGGESARIEPRRTTRCVAKELPRAMRLTASEPTRAMSLLAFFLGARATLPSWRSSASGRATATASRKTSPSTRRRRRARHPPRHRLPRGTCMPSARSGRGRASARRTRHGWHSNASCHAAPRRQHRRHSPTCRRRRRIFLQ